MNFNITIQKTAILLFFIMFVYSGINKIPKFSKLETVCKENEHYK